MSTLLDDLIRRTREEEASVRSSVVVSSVLAERRRIRKIVLDLFGAALVDGNPPESDMDFMVALRSMFADFSDEIDKPVQIVQPS